MTNKPIIKLENDYHRDQKAVLIKFDYNTRFIEQVKSIQSRKWSQTKRCWYIPASDFHLDTFRQKLSGIADIDASNIEDNVINYRR